MDRFNFVREAGSKVGIGESPSARTAGAARVERLDELRKGDTVGKIAEEHLAAAGRYPEIFEANQRLLKDPNHIYPGQVLRIPQS